MVQTINPRWSETRRGRKRRAGAGLNLLKQKETGIPVSTKIKKYY